MTEKLQLLSLLFHCTGVLFLFAGAGSSAGVHAPAIHFARVGSSLIAGKERERQGQGGNGRERRVVQSTVVQ